MARHVIAQAQYDARIHGFIRTQYIELEVRKVIQSRRVVPVQRSVLVGLENGLLPRRLMRLLSTELLEPEVADQRIRGVVLKFRRVSACFLGKVDEILCPVEIAIEVRTDFRNEINWI